MPLGAIAQLGERLLCKQEVVGSIPSGSTYASPANQRFLVTVQRLVSITRFGLVGGESCGVERLEAKAVYDSGREVCVRFILDLAARHALTVGLSPINARSGSGATLLVLSQTSSLATV